MSPNRPRSAAWAPAAVLALLLVPAWSDVAGRRAPCAPVEDRGPPRVAARPRAAPVQWSIGDPTDEEQLLLELMNRARADPAAEGDRVFEDYGSSVVTSAVDFFLKQSPGVEYTRAENRDAFHTYAARPPFAFDAHLLDAARVHSQLMRQFNVQSHRVTQAGEKALRDRLTDAGFDGTSLAESVFAYAQDMLDAHAGFAIDYGQGVLQGETRPYLGHRLSLMGFDGDPARNYAVVGVGAISDPDDPGDPNDVGPRLVTIDFGIPANAPTSFVTGVCWADLNQNGFYDLVFLGVAPDGTKLAASVKGDRDPGYGSTSKMISECAICLLRDAADTAPGIWTPGAAMGRKLIKRLEEHAGITFRAE